MVLAALLAPALPAAAQEDAAALRREVERLRDTVKGLDAKVQDLEQRLAAPPTPTAVAPPGAAAVGVAPAATETPAPEERWRSLQRGMRGAAVEKLLGKPTRTLVLNGTPVWYYTYAGVGSGSVAFNSDGQVEGWQRPPFRVWWWN